MKVSKNAWADQCTSCFESSTTTTIRVYPPRVAAMDPTNNLRTHSTHRGGLGDRGGGESGGGADKGSDDSRLHC